MVHRFWWGPGLLEMGMEGVTHTERSGTEWEEGLRSRTEKAWDLEAQKHMKLAGRELREEAPGTLPGALPDSHQHEPSGVRAERAGVPSSLESWLTAFSWEGGQAK